MLCVVAKITWTKGLLEKLGTCTNKSTYLYCPDSSLVI